MQHQRPKKHCSFAKPFHLMWISGKRIVQFGAPAALFKILILVCLCSYALLVFLRWKLRNTSFHSFQHSYVWCLPTKHIPGFILVCHLHSHRKTCSVSKDTAKNNLPSRLIFFLCSPPVSPSQALSWSSVTTNGQLIVKHAPTHPGSLSSNQCQMHHSDPTKYLIRTSKSQSSTATIIKHLIPDWHAGRDKCVIENCKHLFPFLLNFKKSINWNTTKAELPTKMWHTFLSHTLWMLNLIHKHASPERGEAWRKLPSVLMLE